MTVAELIKILSRMPEDAEVRIAATLTMSQEMSVGKVVGPYKTGDHLSFYKDGTSFDKTDDVVFIEADDMLCFLRDEAAITLGWQ